MLQKISEICPDLSNLAKRSLVKKGLFTSLSCWFILLLGKMLLVEAYSDNTGCKIVKASDVIIGDCYMKRLSNGIPQHLDHNLKVLNLSRTSNFYNITNHSFIKYKDTLTTLDLSHLNVGPWEDDFILDHGTFHSLFKLEYLDMTNTCSSKKFALPNNIRILKIENCSTFLNVAHLKLLEEFHAAGNNWTEAPRFYTLAPLKYVDLRRNALNYFAVESIAPYCELKAMFMDGFPSKNNIRRNFNNASIYCTCRALDSWLTSIGVKHRQFDCVPPQSSTPICTSKPSDEAFKLRRKCLARIAAKTITSVRTNFWLILSAIFVLGVLLISTIIVSRRRSRRIQKRDTHDNEEDEEESEED